MSRNVRRTLLDITSVPDFGKNVETTGMEESRNGSAAAGQFQHQENLTSRRRNNAELSRDSSQESLGAASEGNRDMSMAHSSSTGRLESRTKELAAIDENRRMTDHQISIRYHGGGGISFHGNDPEAAHFKPTAPSDMDEDDKLNKPSVDFFIATKEESIESDSQSHKSQRSQGSHASEHMEGGSRGEGLRLDPQVSYRPGDLLKGELSPEASISLNSSLEQSRSGEIAPEKIQAILGHDIGGRGNSNGQASDSSRPPSESGSNTTGTNRSNNKPGSDSKRRKGYWYNVLSPTYKSRSEEFKKLFKDIPNDERLVVDYSCAMQKDILVHGRLYVTQNWVCFYANIFRWETCLTIRCKDIISMTKEKTARVIPNAIQICTKEDKYFFTSFGTRDKTYLMMFRVWQNALTEQYMTPQELWQWVHYSYGDELALTSDDEDYVAPTIDEAVSFQSKLANEERHVSSVQEAASPHPSDSKEPPDDSDLINGELGHLSVPSPTSLDSVSVATASTEDSNVISGGVGGEKRGTSPPTSLQVPSLDTIVNGDLPTDMGDTTEDDDDIGEVVCEGHDHYDIDVINEELDIGVDKCFEYIFSDSKVYRAFTTAKKTFDVQQTVWPDDTDADGYKSRTIKYVLSLNYSIGPKTSPTEEKQTMYSTSRPGVVYHIESECVNGGIPYGENFYVVNRYCINRIASNKCRLRVTSQIKYRKSVWGLVKNFIEKNATAGIIETFNIMANCIREEIERTIDLHTGQVSTRKKVRRRKRNTSDRAPAAKQPPTDTHTSKLARIPVGGIPSQALKAKEEWHIQLTADSLVKIVCVVLLVLLLLNATLFYKLWNLESRAYHLQHSGRDLLQNIQTQPKSQDDWMKVLEQQQELHEAEVLRWKDVLSASVQLMDNMKGTLLELQDSIERRTRFTAAPPKGEQ